MRTSLLITSLKLLTVRLYKIGGIFMEEVIKLSLLQLSAAYIFIVILLIIVRIRKIPREKVIIIAAIRMSIQLVLIGYVLVFLFDNMHPLLTILVIISMEAFATYTLSLRDIKYKN